MSNKKYTKWTPEWEKEVITRIGGKKEEKTIKKDEVKPDGTLATKEEKINTNEVELLLGQIKYQKEIIKTKKAELDKKQKYGEEAKQILKEIKQLEPKVKEWDKFASWFESAYEKFLNGGTDGYGTGNVGWKALLETYLKSKYKKVANTSPSETNNATATEDYGSNLYQFNTRTETDFNQISYWKVTENEVIKLITRTIKEIGNIDYNKFVAYSNSQTHPLSTNTGELDKAEFTATKLQGYLKDVQDRAKCLVDNKIKTEGHPNKGKPANGQRVEYSFGQDFTKHGTNTPVDSGNFTQTELIGLFRLTRAFQEPVWNGHTDFKAATANVGNDTLIVLPAKSSPMTKSDFTTFTPEDLGIPVDSSGKSNFYATDYGTKISGDEEEEKVEYSWDTKKELKIEQGIQGWANLIHGITNTGYNDCINRQKLISSFTDDPVRQLLADIRSYVQKDNSLKTDKDGSGTTTPDYACFGSGTDCWTYHEFPDFQLKEESRLNGYEMEKASLLEGVKNDRESLKTTEKEHQEAKKELVKKKNELESKINEAITAKRKELKDKFKVSDTEVNDFTDNKKITASEHCEFQRLVKEIRFLVNNDEETPTGKTNEDNSFQSSQEVIQKANTAWLKSSWTSIGWKDGATETENYTRTNSEKIKIIKENENGKYDGKGLNFWHDCLVELEKLVKLTDQQQKIKDDLKTAIDNQTPEENLVDWQNSLKKYDAGLETIFDQTKLDKWKQKKDDKEAFNNLASIQKLLEKVCVKKADGTIEKIADDFIVAIKKLKKADGSEAGINTLSELINQKEPVEVIKIIIRYSEYDKLSDDDKKTKKQKLVWTLEKKDEDGKYLDDADLTEEEITNTLYEIAIGKKSLASQKKENESDDNQTPEETSNKSWLKFGKGNIGKPLFTYSLILLAIIGLAAFIFWKQISEWWNGPAEEETAGTTEKTEEDDE